MSTPILWDETRPRFADVSRWVKVGDMSAYAADNTARCLGVKVAEGMGWGGMAAARTVVDQARAANLIVIGYAYGPGSVETFLETFPPRAGCIPCLDFEFGGGRLITAADWKIRIVQAERWCSTVAAAWARPPWFYGRATWIAAGQPEGTRISECGWWGPQYGPHLRVPAGVGRPVAWQYSDGSSGPEPHTHAGIEPGRDGRTKRCDMNALLVSIPDLRAQAGLANVVDLVVP